MSAVPRAALNPFREGRRARRRPRSPDFGRVPAPGSRMISTRDSGSWFARAAPECPPVLVEGFVFEGSPSNRDRRRARSHAAGHESFDPRSTSLARLSKRWVRWPAMPGTGRRRTVFRPPTLLDTTGREGLNRNFMRSRRFRLRSQHMSHPRGIECVTPRKRLPSEPKG